MLAANPATVSWLTGYGVEIETGPSPFALGPLALLSRTDGVVVIASEDEAPAVRELGIEVVSYPGFSLGPLNALAEARRALERAVAGRRVATELGALPAGLAIRLSYVDASAEIEAAKAIKDPDELEAIRAAIAVCDLGQKAARELAAPGMTELELWGAIRSRIESFVGRRLPVLADLLSGPRTAEIGGPPTERALKFREPILFDLVPRVGCYWGDSCSTFVLGEPDSTLTRLHTRAMSVLEQAVKAVRPGAPAASLDAHARQALSYPHHTGHGLGTSYHERPRIVPGSDETLAPGMVIALEPGVYEGENGVRVEAVVVVTDEGCEILSGHSLSLSADDQRP